MMIPDRALAPDAGARVIRLSMRGSHGWAVRFSTGRDRQPRPATITRIPAPSQPPGFVPGDTRPVYPPAAARSTNQMSSPSGLTRAAGTSLPPARMVLKIAALPAPATRNATRRLLSITG